MQPIKGKTNHPDPFLYALPDSSVSPSKTDYPLEKSYTEKN